MRVSVYLHRYISDVLKTFGELNDVINRILEACEDGSIDVCYSLLDITQLEIGQYLNINN